jgi:flagellar biosynthesis/type III secretory pathway protein FliH
MSFVTVSSTRNKVFVQAVLSQDTASIAAQEAEVARRVRLEVSKLREKTEAETRAAMEEEAHAALAPQIAALNSANAALCDAWAQMAAPLAQKERDLAELVTELSFLLARHIMGMEAATNPASLQSMVARLLAEAAAERGPRQMLVLRVNPADHAHLVAHVPEEIASLLADEKIAPGGALIEIIAPDGDPLDKIEWDATVQGRLENIGNALALPGGSLSAWCGE